jgi:putative hydrolase of the HAD superfamily
MARGRASFDRMTIRAIFYDAGHTLVRPRPDFDEVWDFLGHQLGVEIALERRGSFPDVGAFFYSRLGEDGLGSYASDAAARSFWSEYYAYALRDVVPEMSREEVIAAGEALYDWYKAPEQWQPFPEVPETLRRVKEMGLIQGVVSDWGSDLLPILHAHEITMMMDFVVASAVVGSSKPHREIFLYALGRANVRPEETIYVGDSYLADVLGSRGAGLHPVLIDREGRAPKVDARVIGSWVELIEGVGEL